MPGKMPGPAGSGRGGTRRRKPSRRRGGTQCPAGLAQVLSPPASLSESQVKGNEHMSGGGALSKRRRRPRDRRRGRAARKDRRDHGGARSTARRRRSYAHCPSPGIRTARPAATGPGRTRQGIACRLFFVTVSGGVPPRLRPAGPGIFPGRPPAARRRRQPVCRHPFRRPAHEFAPHRPRRGCRVRPAQPMRRAPVVIASARAAPSPGGRAPR